MEIEELDQRVKAVERLTVLYRPERIVYLAITSISLIALLYVAGTMIVRDKYTPVELTLMFGSSGIMGYTASQLLRMWDRAISVIAPEHIEAKK